MTSEEQESKTMQETPVAINDTVKIEEQASGQGAELAACQKSLEEQKALAAEYLDQLRRAAADFANYRKRQEREQQQRAAWANAELLLSLLPVLDDLERALQELPVNGQEASWAEGVRLVARKMQATLQKAGMEEINAARGQPFDPNVHEAVMYEPSAEVAEAAIIQVVGRGYKMGERVLRPAMVRVARTPLP